jgi:DNA-binding response OmpR family regulator
MGAAGACVLVVEDDEDIREILVETLRFEEFVVVQADDGRAALDLLASRVVMPDVLLLDLDPALASIDGAELLATARATIPEFARVQVVMTSPSGDRGRSRVPPDAVSAWLPRPIGLDELIATMSALALPVMDRSVGEGRRRLLRYLSRRRNELSVLREALAVEDFTEIEAIARRIGTTGRGFGVVTLALAGERLAAASSTHDGALVAASVRGLADVVMGLQEGS